MRHRARSFYMLVGTLVFVFVASTRGEDPPRHRGPLEAIDALEVVGESIQPELGSSGVTTSLLRSEVARRPRESGVPV